MTVESLSPDRSASTASSVSAHNLSVLCGIVLGVVLFSLLARSQSDFAAGDVGLGLNTVPFTATHDGRFIAGPIEDLERMHATFAEVRREEPTRPIALWLGASQLYAINQPKEGDRLAVEYATERAEERDSDLVYLQSANPNANLNEILWQYVSYREKGLVPDLLVLGFTFDDLKEPGFRQKIIDRIEPLPPETLTLLGPAGEQITQAMSGMPDGDATSSPVERTATGGTPQERLEDELVALLEEAWPAYRDRGSVRSASIMAWKIPLTVAIFKLLSRPKVVIDEETREWNEAALDALLAIAKADGVKVVLYQAPYRPDPNVFYHVRSEYDACHAALEELCNERGVRFRDLETIVPAEFWGMTNDGSPDVYHFRDEGHRLLGDAIDAWLAEEGH